MVEADFEVFARRRWRPLMRAAWLLAGDWATAEDLVQATLTKVWTAWETVSAADSPNAYVHRMLTNEFLAGRRRRMSSEVVLADLPDSPAAGSDVDRRMALISALATLPPQQRATVVLRFFADLTVEQAAQALGCSVGNVKSQTSRALEKLRASDHLDALLGETS